MVGGRKYSQVPSNMGAPNPVFWEFAEVWELDLPCSKIFGQESL